MNKTQCNILLSIERILLLAVVYYLLVQSSSKRLAFVSTQLEAAFESSEQTGCSIPPRSLATLVTVGGVLRFYTDVLPYLIGRRRLTA